MVSSVVRNLNGERDAILQLFRTEKYSFVELLGADPYDSTSLSESSGSATVKYARDCDLYILILGKDYGCETAEGKSATEVEYDAAIKTDPTKVLIFLKSFNEPIEPPNNVSFKKYPIMTMGIFEPVLNIHMNYSQKLNLLFGIG